MRRDDTSKNLHIVGRENAQDGKEKHHVSGIRLIGKNGHDVK